MKKISTIVLMTLAALMLFASCEQNVDIPEPEKNEGNTEHTIVDVSLVVEEEKSLKSDLNRDIKFWEFKATPKFTLADGEVIYGAVSYWRTLDELNTEADGIVKKAANLGRYTSGDWYFQLRALNSNKHVVAVGSTQQVIREGLDNTIKITVLTDRADGTQGESADATSKWTGWDGHSEGTKAVTVEQYGSLHVGMIVNRLDEDIDKMQIVTHCQKVNKDGSLARDQKPEVVWTSKGPGQDFSNWYLKATPKNYKEITEEKASGVKVEEGKVYYEATIDSLEAGPYLYTFFVQGQNKAGSWINLGGQVINVTVVGGEETQVKGTLLANEYVQAGLAIKAPGTIYGTINNVNYIKGTVKEPIELRWNQTEQEQEDSGEEATSFYWYVNGEKSDNTTGTFTFKCPENPDGSPIYGIYRVSVTPTGNLGSIGNATVDIIFNPETGPNVGEFDWSGIIVP